MESSKITHTSLFFYSGWPIISSEREKEIQGHPFKDACSVMPVLIALDSLCLQIQAFTEQFYLLCPEALPILVRFPYSALAFRSSAVPVFLEDCSEIILKNRYTVV